MDKFILDLQQKFLVIKGYLQKAQHTYIQKPVLVLKVNEDDLEALGIDTLNFTTPTFDNRPMSGKDESDLITTTGPFIVRFNFEEGFFLPHKSNQF